MVGLEMAVQVLFAGTTPDLVTLDVVVLEDIEAVPDVPVGAPVVLHLRPAASLGLDALVAATLERWAAGAAPVDVEVGQQGRESSVTLRDATTVVRLDLDSVVVLVP